MRPTACLQRDDAARLPGEELQYLPPHKPAAEQPNASLVRPVHMKNVLRDIQTNRANLRHGRLLRWCSTPPPWHIDAVGGRPPHHPKRTSASCAATAAPATIPTTALTPIASPACG